MHQQGHVLTSGGNPAAWSGVVSGCSGLPSFLVTSQIGHDQLRLNGSVSLLAARVNVLRLHHTMPRTASLHLPFRFIMAKLMH
jgi:hypothetical protein